MGVGNLSEIVQALYAAGMNASTLGCVIQNGTLATQRSVVATLSTLSAAVAEAGIGSPAIIVIGGVVKFAREKMRLENSDVAYRPRRDGSGQSRRIY